jgi:hypothetical protein
MVSTIEIVLYTHRDVIILTLAEGPKLITCLFVLWKKSSKTHYVVKCSKIRPVFFVSQALPMCILWYTIVYSLQTTAYSLQSTVYSLQSTVYSLKSTVYSLQSAVCSLQSTVYSLKSTAYSLQSIVYSLQYIVYSLSRC